MLVTVMEVEGPLSNKVRGMKATPVAKLWRHTRGFYEPLSFLGNLRLKAVVPIASEPTFGRWLNSHSVLDGSLMVTAIRKYFCEAREGSRRAIRPVPPTLSTLIVR